MDLADFVALVTATPLLSEDDRRRHLARAESYSPQLRGRMAAIIAEEQAGFVERYREVRRALQESANERLETVRRKEEGDRSAEISVANALVGDIPLC